MKYCGLNRKDYNFFKQRITKKNHYEYIYYIVNRYVFLFRSVLEYVTSNPPVPVVIFDGSGRAADILAFAYR